LRRCHGNAKTYSEPNRDQPFIHANLLKVLRPRFCAPGTPRLYQRLEAPGIENGWMPPAEAL
jgi:hypothetical protein